MLDFILKDIPYKVARDPIHSEIKMYPLELAFIDTPIMQRLRFLSQLVGAQLAYPGATHTRFAHSLGTMHVAGLYASNLWKEEPRKILIVRLAGLLHDIGHGPFSHQFDDVIFRNSKYRDHDEYRVKLLRELGPKYLLSSISAMKPEYQRYLKESLAIITGRDEVTEDNLRELIEAIIEVYEGEETGTPEFNVTQGILGADRLDFLARDSFYSGTLHFGSAPIDRLTRNAMIIDDRLAYPKKVIDDIYSMLFSRFMMYKNVYFHKLGRAVDMMIQEILKLSTKYIDYEWILENPEEFLKLTDISLLTLIEMKAQEHEDDELLGLINDFKNRRTWKLLIEVPFAIEGVDPLTYAQAFEEETMRLLKDTVQELMSRDDLDELSLELLRKLREQPERYIKVDTPFRLTLLHPQEFLDTDILIYDEVFGKTLNFEEFLLMWPTYKLMREGLVQLLRVYVTIPHLRDLLVTLKDKIYSRIRGKTLTRW